MNLIDLLNSDEAELPFTSKDNFEEQLKDRFEGFLTKASKLDTNDSAAALVHAKLSEIQKLAEGLEEALRFWLDAKPEEALTALEGGLTSLEKEVELLSSNKIDAEKAGTMYRVRLKTLDARFKREDMFHIPFQQRDRVATQRYSFPGFPCLYLGRSVYACWEEMGRPELHSQWISRFVIAPDETVRVLDFGFRPAMIAAGLDQSPNYQDFAASYAILWPLIAACSVRTPSGKKRSFVVEYVLPQLLLRWLIRRGQQGSEPMLDGIRYFSTHIDDYMVEMAGVNYVFPARERQPNGPCPVLMRKFNLSSPVNWQIAMTQARQPQTDQNRMEFAMAANHLADYRETDFGRVESFLEVLKTDSIAAEQE